MYDLTVVQSERLQTIGRMLLKTELSNIHKGMSNLRSVLITFIISCVRNVKKEIYRCRNYY